MHVVLKKKSALMCIKNRVNIHVSGVLELLITKLSEKAKQTQEFHKNTWTTGVCVGGGDDFSWIVQLE